MKLKVMSVLASLLAFIGVVYVLIGRPEGYAILLASVTFAILSLHDRA